MKKIACLVFPGFELLDVFGPLEMYGVLPEEFGISMIAETAAPVASDQGPRVAVDATIEDGAGYDVILVPGGAGTRAGISNAALVDWLRSASRNAELVTGVCTGAALLATSGVLDGLLATTNKAHFAWVASLSDKVNWVPEARWVEDGKVFTSSGVTAGMDMTLAVIARLLGENVADGVAVDVEYEWRKDSTQDPFAKIHGLV